MSAISEKVRVALFAKLNVSDVTGLVTGIFHKQAPEGTARPYVIFQRQAPGPAIYALGNNLAAERDLWMIKALTDEDSSQTLEPEALGEAILAACETAIGDSMTLTGNTVRMVRRTQDIPSYTEKLSDRSIYHQGFFLDIFTE